MTEGKRQSGQNALSPTEIKEILRAIKRQVFELEKENTTHLFLYYTGNKWHKLGGNSALILMHLIAPQIKGYKPILRPDGDYDSRFATGTISVRDVPRFRNMMKDVDVVEDKEFKPKNRYILVFKLPKKIKKEDLRKVMGEQDAARQELNRTLALSESDPELAALIRALEKVTYQAVKKMGKIERELVGNKLMDLNMRLYIEYRNWAVGNSESTAGLDLMMEVIDEMTGYMLIIMENNVLDTNQIAAYTFRMEAIRSAIKKRHRLIEKRETKVG